MRDDMHGRTITGRLLFVPVLAFILRAAAALDRHGSAVLAVDSPNPRDTLVSCLSWVM